MKRMCHSNPGKVYSATQAYSLMNVAAGWLARIPLKSCCISSIIANRCDERRRFDRSLPALVCDSGNGYVFQVRQL